MEEIIKYAQVSTPALMTGAVVWVLWYMIAKGMPDLQARHNSLVMEMQKKHDDAIVNQRESFVQLVTEQRQLFERTVKIMEDRANREMESCERRHVEAMQLLDRVSVQLNEISYEIDSHSGTTKRGPGTKNNPPDRGKPA